MIQMKAFFVFSSVVYHSFGNVSDTVYQLDGRVQIGAVELDLFFCLCFPGEQKQKDQKKPNN